MFASSKCTLRILMALVYALVRHWGQTRKSDPCMPYIFHPVLTAWLVWKYGNLQGEDRVQAMILALLHDVLEDTNATSAESRFLFGKEMADAVVAISHDKKIKQAGGTKREILDEKLDRMQPFPMWVRVVETASRFANVLEPGDQPPAERVQYIENSLHGYRRNKVDAPRLYTRLNQELIAAQDVCEVISQNTR